MVRGKETFERWSTKKKPNHVQSSRKMEGPRRDAEKSSRMRKQTDSGDRTIEKGMKRTPPITDSFPPPSPHGETSHSPAHIGGQEAARRSEFGKEGRDVLQHEDNLPFGHMDNGSPDFCERRINPKKRVAGQVLLYDPELLSPNEHEQRQPHRSSWTGQLHKSSMSKDVKKVSSPRKYGSGGTSSRMRSCSNSSGSSERDERPRQGRTTQSIEQYRKHRSPSTEQDSEHPPHMHQSSWAAGRSSSMKEQEARKGSGERRRKRHCHSSRSNESDTKNYRQSLQRSSLPREQSRGRYGSPKENSKGSDRSPLLLSEAGSEQSEDSREGCKGRDTEGFSSSASLLHEEVKDEAGILVKSETTLRKERRDRQKSRERQIRSREKQGQKAYYLKVNHSGKPYGDGAPAWRADLNKLSRSLDPSVMDVREQPPTEMATLRRRLRQNFDYSDPVDPIFIRQLVGKAITQWRNTLWKKMDAGAPRPRGFDEGIWTELERTRSCPSHNEKSERMKHANRCRITLGRTGPLGEEGIRESLRKQKGFSPDYDDIFIEMQRDKGYGGRAAEKKARKKAHAKVAVELKADRTLEYLPSIVQDMEVAGSKRGSTSMALSDKGLLNEDKYVKSLESKIAELQAQISKGVHVDRQEPVEHVDREEPVEYNFGDDKENASRSDRLYVDKEKETNDGQRGRSRGDTHSPLPELREPISKGGSGFNNGRQKLRSNKGL